MAFFLFIFWALTAGAPILTITPVTPTSIILGVANTATIQYQVTNNANALYTVHMQPIPGITTSGCDRPLGKQDSCLLTLTVTGSQLSGDVNGGPVLCNRGNSLQCYQPSPPNSLAIHLALMYTVTATSGASQVTISDGSVSQLIALGTPAMIQVTSSTGYYPEINTITTTCPTDGEGWNAARTQYTTGTISGACQVDMYAISQALTSMSLSPSSNPVNTTDELTLTAHVIANDGSVPTGLISFFVNNNPACGGPVTLDGGIATCSGQVPDSGQYLLSVSYAGDTTHVGSSAAFFQYVTESVIPTVPAQPLNVVVTPGSDTNGSAMLSWAPPVNTGGRRIQRYSVEYSADGGSTWNSATYSSETETSGTVNHLNSGGTYTFRVLANNDAAGVLYGYSSPITLPSQFCPDTSHGNGIVAISPTPLALAASGNSRTITVTNVTTAANIVTINSVSDSNLPSGTSIDFQQAKACLTGTELHPGESCTITVSPGTSTGSSIIPIAVSSTDCSDATLAADVLVLDSGSPYQGGLIYAIDDTTPVTSSMGGHVIAPNDATDSPQAWWVSGGYADTYGISDVSTIAAPDPSAGFITNQLNCNGASDGYCNSNNMLWMDGRTAASSCSGDWYLPSICEMGNVTELQCPSGTSIASLGRLTGNYWSSTQSSGTTANAWFYNFTIADAATNTKLSLSYAIRCARALTP